MHWAEDFFDEYYLITADKLISEQQTRKEVDFLISHVPLKPDSAILDLACGQGRHVLELARRGFVRVEGLDASGEYLEIARKQAASLANAPEFRQANMRELAATDQYQLVYSLLSSLFYFEDELNLEIIGRVYKSLKREGYFVLDYFNPFPVLKQKKLKNWYITKDETVVLDKISHNPISGKITNERLIITPDGRRIKKMFHVRDYMASELRYHFEHIGFEVLNVYGDFEGTPYHLDAPRQIFIMKKPD